MSYTFIFTNMMNGNDGASGNGQYFSVPIETMENQDLKSALEEAWEVVKSDIKNPDYWALEEIKDEDGNRIDEDGKIIEEEIIEK